MSSAELNTLLHQAFDLHQKGDFRRAEILYRSILRTEPKHLDACQLLGAALVQLDRPQEAVGYLRRAIEQHGEIPQYHVNLGSAYSRLKDHEAAANCYREALRLEWNNLDAHQNLGSVLIKQSKFAMAVPHLQHALAIAPKSQEVLLNLAIALQKSEREEEAIPHFESYIALHPEHRRALTGLGQALLNRDEAEEKTANCWQKLVDLEPGNPAFQNNLATILKNLRRIPEAELAARRALELSHEYLPALCNLGMILANDGRFSEAQSIFERAVAISETPPSAPKERLGDSQGGEEKGAEKYSNATLPAETWTEMRRVAFGQLAAVASAFGDLKSAHAALDQALAIDPKDVDSHMMRGFAYLSAGDFPAGLEEYEWRRKTKHKPRQFPKPEWRGEAAPGKTLLIHAEQGLGDAIHFVRYAALARKNVGRVVLLSHKPVASLMRLCPDVSQVVADGDPLPSYDLHIPLMSLPRALGTTLDSVPNDVPYLFPETDLVDPWRSRLAGDAAFRIGICWQGNRDFANDQYRSVPLRCFKGFTDLPKVRLIALQKGDGCEQLDEIDFPVTYFPEMDQESGAFMDTAAVMSQVDLVISTDTAVPHLAGALGVPVWLATCFNCEWRWLTDRSDSPWYPSMRLFRQTQLGDWDSVFRTMADELQLRLENWNVVR